MKISLAIHFPSWCLNIFDIFFDPSVATVEKYVEKSRNSSCVKKYIENISTTLGKVNCPAKIHYCTAIV